MTMQATLLTVTDNIGVIIKYDYYISEEHMFEMRESIFEDGSAISITTYNEDEMEDFNNVLETIKLTGAKLMDEALLSQMRLHII